MSLLHIAISRNLKNHNVVPARLIELAFTFVRHRIRMFPLENSRTQRQTHEARTSDRVQTGGGLIRAQYSTAAVYHGTTH
jgi:hypothetical protein